MNQLKIKIYTLNAFFCYPKIIIVICLLLTVKLQAQISESPIKDTLFFIKKSNPERTIILPTYNAEVDIIPKKGKTEYVYITGLKDSLLTYRKYSNERESLYEKRIIRRIINDDSTLTRNQRKIRIKALDYMEDTTVNLSSIKEIRIRNRDLKVPAILLKTGDAFLIASPILMSIAILATSNGYTSTYGMLTFFGVLIIDSAIVFSNIAFYYTYVTIEDWVIGSTFND